MILTVFVALGLGLWIRLSDSFLGPAGSAMACLMIFVAIGTTTVMIRDIVGSRRR